MLKGASYVVSRQEHKEGREAHPSALTMSGNPLGFETSRPYLIASSG